MPTGDPVDICNRCGSFYYLSTGCYCTIRKLRDTFQYNKLPSFDQTLTEPVDITPKENAGCNVCGGKMVSIRGKYPYSDKRLVCPTCLAERMDTIREMCDRNYGVASQESKMK